jgi:hypothetical protein
LMLAAGGECCSDIEFLRSEPGLFGSVPSDTTLFRVLRDEVTAEVRNSLDSAVAQVREKVWEREGLTDSTGVLVLDIDVSLHEVYSDNKEGTAGMYKGGVGYAPMYCTADATGEVLAVELRSGNAGANTIADHVKVLDQAIGNLPESIAVGHRQGDKPDAVKRQIQVRTDGAGCTSFVHDLRARNIGYAVAARSNSDVHAAISRVQDDESVWVDAVKQDGELRDGSAVCELTDHVDLSGWPSGTRLIVRREPLHPGAQQTLFESTEYRYWGHYTDTQTTDPVELDRHMRAHAHVEDNIKRIKSSGGDRFPFSKLEANKTWLQLVCWGDCLVRWFQLSCLEGKLAKADPKHMRWLLWRSPARVIKTARRTIIRVLDGWPTSSALTHAYKQTILIS